MRHHFPAPPGRIPSERPVTAVFGADAWKGKHPSRLPVRRGDTVETVWWPQSPSRSYDLTHQVRSRGCARQKRKRAPNRVPACPRQPHSQQQQLETTQMSADPRAGRWHVAHPRSDERSATERSEAPTCHSVDELGSSTLREGRQAGKAACYMRTLTCSVLNGDVQGQTAGLWVLRAGDMEPGGTLKCAGVLRR